MSLSKREYEVYKSGIDKLVYKYLTKERSSASSIITNAITGGADKRKLADKLAGLVDKSTALKLADKAFSLLEDLDNHKSSSRKRSHKDEAENTKDGHDKESKKPRTDKQPLVVSSQSSSTPSESAPTITLHQKQIQDIMAKAQAAIEERKKALSSIGVTPAATRDADGATPASTNGTEVNSRIAELQARIRSQMGSVAGLPVPSLMGIPGLVNPPGLVHPILSSTPMPVYSTPGMGSAVGQPKPPGERPPPIILDSEGRTLDLMGKEVHITSRAPTLKANIRAKKRAEFKEKLSEKPALDELPEADYFDPRVPARPSLRPSKLNFKFHEHGKFVQLAQRERAKARLDKLQNEISTAARRTGISSAARLAELQGDSKDLLISVKTPDIEWWDSVILQSHRYPSAGEKAVPRTDYITNLVEHPLEVNCVTDTDAPVALQVFLTAKERKKLRRMNRREAWKEKQDKIRLGLEPPPEPKVKMANLMRVLGTEAVLDPTKMERHVRDQMAKRQHAHEKANAERKLTPQQRKEKRLAKLKEDTSTGVHVSVYRVTDLSNGSHKFKVETNAKQLFLTGAVVLFKDVNVVVVEGGPKQQKKYRQLMMNRIKWVEEARANTNNIKPKCQLVWEGTTLERNFGELQFKSCPTESFARDHFKRHGVEHYWDMAYATKLAEEADASIL
ncbi:U4/U6 small nuclear ribonucleoprotein Prp3 isoform X2 [Hyalella azteca]|uniref:U4/U6 small nuclear ribonucleoprotein Prp3 isoform X1 n=1 Tax=Hyalella azteca TaxID=294128 RepID=A0A8B7PGY4_HYAAZ|nr:U4/U6 small nuclear ribonucleoprotein Prp3 isoform X1 [Hyalella azteca]XP_018024825.1 U4/U6 small nuclear ribonucleoprotein Prp3 isoform X2 [Hyalella azteca]